MNFLSKIAIVIFLLAPLMVNSQYLTDEKEKEKSNFRERLFFGGNFGVSIGTVTYIELSPIVGYRITDRFSAGVGTNYTYYKEEMIYYDNNGNLNSWDYKSKVYGGKIFSRYILLSNLNETLNINIGSVIAHSEIEYLNVETYTHDYLGQMHQDGRKWITSVLVGGGISQPLGPRSSVNLLLLYNLTEELFTPYSNPIFRINFNF